MLTWGAFSKIFSPSCWATQPSTANVLPFAVFFLELVQAVKDFLFGLIADAAGVVEDQLGRFHGLHLLVALVNQCSDDLLRIVRIHLAPEGLDVERLHSNFIVREPPA